MPWDDPLVQLALTHPSAVSEGSGQEDNQRLEFLGDAVLGLAIGQSLFRRLPADQEGPLSRLRSRLVSREMLAEMGEQLNLADRLKVGHGERLSDPAARQRALTDAFEALIGALFLIWGYLPTQAWVLDVMAEPVEAAVSGLDDGRDPKSMLQEALQHRGTNPVYDVLESIGPAHRRRYRVVVKAAGKVLGRGEGRTKKVAEQDAAKDALEQLAKAELPRRRRAIAKKAEPVVAAPARTAAPAIGEGADEAPPAAIKKRSRRRRKAPSAVVQPAAPPAAEAAALVIPEKRRLVIIHAQDEGVSAPEPAPAAAGRKRRRRSRAKAGSSTLQDGGGQAPASVEGAPAPPLPEAAPKRRRRRSRAKSPASPPAGEASTDASQVATGLPAGTAATASAKRRRRRSRHAAAGAVQAKGFVPKEPAPGAGSSPQPAGRGGSVAEGAEPAATAAGQPPGTKRRRHRGGRRRRKGGTGEGAAATGPQGSEGEAD